MSRKPEQPVEVDPDWRLRATSLLAQDFLVPGTGEVVPKGSRVTVCSVLQLSQTKQLQLPLPNAAALMLSASARAYEAARDVRTRSGVDRSIAKMVSLGSESDAFDFIEHMIQAVIMAFAAVEAFTNEAIPADYVFTTTDHKGRQRNLRKAAIERLATSQKLLEVLPEALQIASPQQSRCWTDFETLKDVRHRLVHPKSVDTKSAGPDEDTVWRAVLLVPPPHRLARSIIEHFVRRMPEKPRWYGRFS